MTDPTGNLLPLTPQLATDSRLAVAGYLARYNGTTRARYELSLELYFRWALAVGLEPVRDVRRPHLELFVRYLEEERGNTPATVNTHLTPLIGLFKFAVIDGYLDRDPAAHLRRPKVYIDESRTLGLDRVELQALLGAAKASPHAQDGAMIALLGLLGLRISEAIKVRIEDFSQTDRGYRILRVVGKGRKPATIPLPVAVVRLLDAAAGERTSGVLLVRRTMHRTTDGLPYTRKTADIALQRLCKRAGIAKRITPHGLRHSFVTAGLDAGVPLRDMQVAARHSDPRITARYDRNRHNLDRHANHIISATIAGAA